MKKIFIAMLLLSSTFAFSQTDSSCSKCKKTTSDDSILMYVSGSLSLSSTDLSKFSEKTYATIEAGIVHGKTSVGIGLGKATLTSAKDLFIEPKVSYVILKTKSLTYTGIVGAGTYFSKGIRETYNKYFVEYGIGACYSLDKFDLCVSFTNWGTNHTNNFYRSDYNYLSAGISKTF